MLHIRLVHMCFAAVTNIRENLSKSNLILAGAMENITYLAELLCCMVGSFPMVDASEVFMQIHCSLECCVGKIRVTVGWMEDVSNQGGRLMLLESMLSSSPTCLCSLFLLLWLTGMREFNETSGGERWLVWLNFI